MAIREVKGMIDRLSMTFLPDEVGLIAEVLNADGQALGSATVQDDGSFNIALKQEKGAENQEVILQVRPDVDEPMPEALRISLKQPATRDGVIDLQKQPLIIPKHLRRLWLPLLEICCVRGRVVSCQTVGTDPEGDPINRCCSVQGAKVEAYVFTLAPWGIQRKVLATAYTDSQGFFRVCTVRIKIPRVIIPNDLPFDWRDLLPVELPLPIPRPLPWPGPDPAPFEGILNAWRLEQKLTGAEHTVPAAMPRLAALEAAQMPRSAAKFDQANLPVELKPTLGATKEAMVRKEAVAMKPEAALRPELAVRPDLKLRPDMMERLTPPPVVTSACSAGWHYRVTQSVNSITQVIYDDGFFPVPHSTWPFGYITLYANSGVVCGEQGPAPGDLGGKCFIFTGVGNIGVDLIHGWADTTPLFAGGGPAPHNVPLVKDAAFAGHLNVYGQFAAGYTHYKVEYARLSGTLRSPGPAGPWQPFEEAFAYATQYINLDVSDANYGEVRTKTIVSTPAAVGAEKLFVIPQTLVEAGRPEPGWQWLNSMQPVVVGVNTAQLLPGGAGQFLFRVTPVAVTAGVVTARCTAAQMAQDLRLVVDNAPVRFGVTSLRDENGESILTAVCPKAHLNDATDALSAAFQVIDDHGHLAGLAASFRIGNAFTETIVPTMVYNNGASPTMPTASYVGAFTRLPAGSVSPMGTGDVSLSANIPAVNWAAKYWGGGSASLQAFRNHWLTLVPAIGTDPCPFAIAVSALKRTTNGITTPGWTTDMRLFVIRP